MEVIKDNETLSVSLYLSSEEVSSLVVFLDEISKIPNLDSKSKEFSDELSKKIWNS